MMKWVKSSKKSWYSQKDGFWYVIQFSHGLYLVAKTLKHREVSLVNSVGKFTLKGAKEYAETI